MHIKWLRKTTRFLHKLGHGERYRGAGIIPWYLEGKKVWVFVMKRRYGPFKNHWAVFGGGLGAAEALWDGAGREFAEEALHDGKVYSLTVFDRMMDSFAQPDEIPLPIKTTLFSWFEYTTYALALRERLPAQILRDPISREASAYGWYEINAIPAPLHFGMRKVIRAIKVEVKNKATESTSTLDKKIF